jgi:hypothetical protein
VNLDGCVQANPLQNAVKNPDRIRSLRRDESLSVESGIPQSLPSRARYLKTRGHESDI